jgi:predicted peptidase
MKKLVAALLTMALIGCGGGDGPTTVLPPGGTTPTGTPPVGTTPGGGTPGFTPPAGGGFVLRSMTAGGIAFPYQIFSPGNWSAGKKWPIIVSFAGSGERGSDGYLQLHDGLGVIVKAQQATFPAVVIFPQVPVTTEGQATQLSPTVMNQVAEVIRDYNGDPARIYLVGYSLGGTLAMDLANDYPTTFAALANISGGMCPNCLDPTGKLTHPQIYAIAAQTLKALPIRLYHGASDPLIPVSEIRILAAAFTSIGAQLQYIEYANTGHEIWDNIFATQDFYDWLFAQHR